ncbi:enoyl-CoA hydratase [Chryseobacterium polytrichastri]|uniref:Uncharacterized protein n=1 Tax=Chryseobacterium polytrichastri TaxID=1302687 RepID=A0A1M7L5N7_9FLAO|nr:enoyl-CoA hydratase [Chryseobacterium polytrichastri]SHM73443.1 hypothetical protein SAMN05444267_10854 [Chryseobacterium polytrichastri]
MKTKEDIFNLIKQTVNLSGKFTDYQIRLSDGRFDRKNMIGVYGIRKGIATRQENFKLAEQIHKLIIGLESDSGILLKGVDIYGKNYSGLFFLSEDWDRVVGYLESETDDNGNIVVTNK